MADLTSTASGKLLILDADHNRDNAGTLTVEDTKVIHSNDGAVQIHASDVDFFPAKNTVPTKPNGLSTGFQRTFL